MPKQVLAVVDDLIFESRIREAAREAGAVLRVVRSAAALAEALPSVPQGGLVLVDLDAMALDSVEAVRVASAAPCRPHVVAWGSHVRVDLLTAARTAGATEALARSAFVARLGELLEPED